MPLLMLSYAIIHAQLLCLLYCLSSRLPYAYYFTCCPRFSYIIMHAIHATYFYHCMLYVYASSNNTTCRFESISPSTCALIVFCLSICLSAYCPYTLLTYLFPFMSIVILFHLCLLLLHTYSHSLTCTHFSIRRTVMVSLSYAYFPIVSTVIHHLCLLPFHVQCPCTWLVLTSVLCFFLYLSKAPHPVWIDNLMWVVSWMTTTHRTG